MSVYKKRSMWRARIAQRLKKFEGKLWKDVADRISKPRQNLAEVNVGQISKNTKKGETVVVPGKVLGVGVIDHNVVVSALSFSDTARRKIEAAKGQCISLEELAEKNPKGSNIKILG